ncbi:N-6 DNA methylase [Oscillochloris sp. ZM17-4]|uniref:type I restriction-modification system subunit M n=1 Tax=Oscillochloris sp. ZM17-4 TaxID=2866714 RepID=UPI001C739007|nr:class I SAM-dependent DNA methyltransferase [Oscillochloris sp. ZM17-4]MBX0326583.1 N-6 DNA methylase [Oscillochloris sp. ZM17-4]
MLTDPRLRSQVDQLWEKFWSGGLTNPLDAIEQFSYLLFLKQLDEAEQRRQRLATMRKQSFTPRIPEPMRWDAWNKYQAGVMLAHVRDQVFPWFRTLGVSGSSFERYMQSAEFKINKPSLLVEAVNAIDAMRISEQNQDVQGDLYEYLLSKLNTAGRNGQFRTPRHIIRMMVKMLNPKPGERIGDLAAGTGGFLVGAYQHLLEQATPQAQLQYDEEGWAHGATGELLTDEQRRFLQEQAFRGYDNDSGMTMLRIGSMNLMLHGIESPRFFYFDTLGKEFREASDYDVILMNPPFKGAVDKGDVSPTLPSTTTKSELLFLHLILRALDQGGRCAVIVPDGVLFGSSGAHVALRKLLVESHRLDGVVSMPGGVFKPYAGVSTAVLLFTRGATTGRIWYYDMEHDGFTLDDKRLPTAENDIADLLACWASRKDTAFDTARQAELAGLRAEAAPLKVERLRLEAELDRLKFARAVAPEGDATAGTALERAQAEIDALRARLAPLQSQINRLSRQFWVEKAQVAANRYDLSASRYRQVERDEPYQASPQLTLERLRELERAMGEEMIALEGLL